MIKLDSLNKLELKEILKQLKTLELLNKNLWRRWISIFKNMIDNKTDFLVEYSSSLDLSFVQEKSLEVFKKTFQVSPVLEDIKFSENKSIKSGIRVFVWDKMIDLTLNKIEKTLV